MMKVVKQITFCLLAIIMMGGMATTANAQWKRKQVTAANLPDLLGVHFMDADNGVAVGDGGADLEDGVIYKSADGGASWALWATQPKMSFSAVQMISATHAVVGGYDLDTDEAVIYYTTNGTSWSKATLPAGGSEISKIKMLDNMTGYSIGYELGTYAFKTSDGGMTWSATEMVADLYTLSMGFADASNGVVGAIDDNGSFGAYYTNNGGTSWSMLSGITGLPTSIHFMDANTGYMATMDMDLLGNTDEALIYKTTDKGATWNLVKSIKSTTADAYGAMNLQFVSATTGYMLWFEDEATKIKRTLDGGITWTDMTTGLGASEEYNDMYFADAEHGVAVGSKGVYGTYNQSVGIADAKNMHTISAYPNPVAGNVVNINMSEAVNGMATITDMAGRVIWSDANLNLRAGQNALSLPYDAMGNGVYYLQLTTPAAVYGSRLNVVK